MLATALVATLAGGTYMTVGAGSNASQGNGNTIRQANCACALSGTGCAMFHGKREGKGKWPGAFAPFAPGDLGFWPALWFGMGVGPEIHKFYEEKLKEFLTMTDEEKKAFLEKMQKEREEREKVIDKLLNGETLTEEEKAIVNKIKEERAQIKQWREKIQKAKALIQKQRAWQTLTEEEKAFIDEVAPAFQKRKGK